MIFLENLDDWKAWINDVYFFEDKPFLPEQFPCYMYMVGDDGEPPDSIEYLYLDDLKKMVKRMEAKE